MPNVLFNRQLKWGKHKTANDYGQFSITCILYIFMHVILEYIVYVWKI